MVASENGNSASARNLRASYDARGLGQFSRFSLYWLVFQSQSYGCERGRNVVRMARNGRRLCDSFRAHAWLFDGGRAIPVSTIRLGDFLVNVTFNAAGFSDDQWPDRFLVFVWMRRELADVGADPR